MAKPTDGSQNGQQNAKGYLSQANSKTRDETLDAAAANNGIGGDPVERRDIVNPNLHYGFDPKPETMAVSGEDDGAKMDDGMVPDYSLPGMPHTTDLSDAKGTDGSAFAPTTMLDGGATSNGETNKDAIELGRVEGQGGVETMQLDPFRSEDQNGIAARSAGGVDGAGAGSSVRGAQNLDAVAVDGDETTTENESVDGMLSATDAEGDGLSFNLVSGPDSGSVIINADGSYSFDPGSDFDHLAVGESQTVTFTFQVTDGKGGFDQGEMEITVTGTNDGPTDIQITNTTIAEEDAGAVIGTLSTSDLDASDTHTYSVSDQRFEVVTDGDGSPQLKLKDGVTLDHEAENGFVSVTITTDDGNGGTYSEDVTINLTDVNEGPSALNWTPSPVTEGDGGAAAGVLSVTDVDTGDTHTFTVSDPRFEVDTSGPNPVLKLKDGVTLDHEAASTVDVAVTVTDSAGASITETLTVSVSDVNDGPTDISISGNTIAENADGAVVGSLSTADQDLGDTHTYTVSDPRFEIDTSGASPVLKLKDGVSLDHEAEGGSVTVSVTTDDGNGGTYSEDITVNVSDVNDGPSALGITPSAVAEGDAGATAGVLSVTDEDVGDTHTFAVSDPRFEVDTSGPDPVLKLKDGVTLDHETASTVDVSVTVTDVSGSSITETFSVSVTDVNEGPTDIDITGTTIAENADGAVVGTLSTTDEDVGDTHSYTLSDSRFEVVTDADGDPVLKLKDGVSLDHETESSVTVTVTADDGNGGTYSEDITVNVSDVNEAVTAVDSTATTSENTDVSGSVSASDLDGDALSYSLVSGPAEGSVTVNPDGSYSFDPGADFDDLAVGETREVRFTFEADDGRGSTDQGEMVITVTGTNDGPTDISISNATINENADGAVVGTLSSSDLDTSDTHTYTVSDSRFEIDTSGASPVLKLKDGVSLDHEAEGGSVTVSVTTDDGNGGTYSENITVNVSDVNDGPTDINISGNTVAENAAGVTVGTLSTVDQDSGDTHSYTVSDSRFEVDTSGASPVLKLKDGVSLDHETEGGSVTVSVTTDDGNGGTYSENITVNVSDVNDGPTDINISGNTIAENAAGATVGTLSTVDQDSGDTHSYTVSDSRFEIDTSGASPVLKLKDGVSLDHEAEGGSVTVSVTTDDGNGGTYSENITVNVSDVNEGPTDINISGNTIAENADGAVVGTLSTVDQDSGDTHTYTVSDSRFEVDTSGASPVLKLKDGVSLDHEAESSVTVSVTTDDGNGGTYSENITVNVSDVSEGAVSAISDTNSAADAVLENASVGSSVGITASASDADGTDSVTYSLSDDAGGLFAIDANTGEVTVAGSIDREAAASHTIEVTATSTDGSTSTQSYTINVGDVNEFGTGATTDTDAAANSVAENAANGTKVGITASASDADATDSVTYSLSDDADGRFTIDTNTGEISVADGSKLDHESDASHTVTVLSTSSDGSTSSETFTINVGDVNEGPTDISISGDTVAENAAGATVGTLSTTDEDVGDTHTYTVSDSRFEIDTSGASPVLKLKDGVSLDHEAEGGSVTVSVTTDDGNGGTYSENITVNVSDVNDGPTDINISGNTIAENADGAVVGTLSTADQDSGDTHTYTVSDSRFEIDTSGASPVLKLKDGVSLDHEAEGGSVTVSVTTDDGNGGTYSENITVNVSDVNDGPTDINISGNTVAENAAGATVGTLSTVDQDSGDTHSYTVSDSRFEVVDDGSGNKQLKLKDGQSLDHEAEGGSVTVSVTTDDGNGGTYSENITVNVSDVNDGPTDINISGNTIAENADGAVVGTLSTADQDSGDTHTYTVSDSRFEIDTSGASPVLKLKDGVSLDHEAEGGSVTVSVTTDDGNGGTYSENITVNVSDVNDGPTDINISGNTVAENAAGATVGTLSTVDQDSGDTHSYTVSDSRFEIDTSGASPVLKLKDGVSLDHEAEGGSVTVSVTTDDGNGGTYSENITVNVSDVNEGPTDINISGNTIAENADGAVVGTLSTVDQDSGDTHTYTVSDSRFEVDTSGASPVLKLKDGVSLDHEAESSVTVSVTTDDGNGGTYSEDITVNVSDVNEGPTGFTTPTSHSVSIQNAGFEAQQLSDGMSANQNIDGWDTTGSVVGVWDVNNSGFTDAPEGENTAYLLGDATASQTLNEDFAPGQSYSLSAMVGDRGPSIDANGWEIRIYAGNQLLGSVDNSDFDPPEGQFIEASLTLSADELEAFSDHYGEPLRIELFNTGNGDEINFDDIRLETTAEISVGEGDGNGTPVTQITATDPDEGDTHTYSLVDDANGAFAIDPNTGIITVADSSKIDYETAQSMDVTVQVTDSGGLTYNDVVTITINDADEADVSAISDTNSAADAVLENASVGSSVGITASASDADGTDSVTYSLSDDAGGLFAIDANTGEVTVAGSIDREAAASHTIEVTATSTDGSTSTQSYTINVGDVNESGTGATTDTDAAANTVSENAANGTTVGITASASDADATDSVTYSLSDDADGRFTIDTNTGEISVADGSKLDHESDASHTVTVLSTSSDGSTSSETFTINVGDVNEGPTDISISGNTIAENEDGAVVGTLSTTDEDVGDTHTYTVSDSRFEIDTSGASPVLKLKDGVSLDHEAESGSVTVSVTTDDGNGGTYSENITVNVSDVNEAVTDINISGSQSVQESVTDGGTIGSAYDPAGTVVANLSAIDEDGGDSHTFTIQSATDQNGDPVTIDSSFPFEVQGNTIVVKAGGHLDHETISQYDIVVEVEDGAGNTVSKTVSVSVTDYEGSKAQDSAAEIITGTSEEDHIIGGDGADTINAGDGNDVIDLFTGTGAWSIEADYATDHVDAGAGDDQIIVGFGNNETIDGGTGTDTLSFNGFGGVNTVNVDLGAGTYSVYAAGNGTISNVENVYGGHLSDTITGDSGDNVLHGGGNGNDRLTGGGGNDSIDGGTGTDTAVFSGDRSDYTITDNGNGGYTVVDNRPGSPDGTDTVTNVENFEFADGTITVGNILNEGPTDIDISGDTIAENVDGAVVGTLSATDADAGDTHTYTVSDSRFEVVDDGSGNKQLKLKDGQSLDHEAEGGDVVVTVTVDDGRQGSYSEDITINVSDVNEGPTDINISGNTVAENAAGATVGTLSTVDQDSADTHTYTVSDSRFEVVDDGSGNKQLKLKDGQSLDHEAEGGSVMVSVTTDDGNGGTYSENITVNVSDVNDGPSDINISGNTIAENAAGAAVGTLSTVDQDSGDTHTYTVSDSRFEIDTSGASPVLKLKDGVSLDHESEGGSVTVSVTTDDGNGGTYSENLTVNVSDVNEGPTDIGLSGFHRVAENADGATIGILSTVDEDNGDTHTYTVSDSRFEVNTSGDFPILRLKDGVSLDYETETSVNLTITTDDGNGGVYSENMTINVTDVVDTITLSDSSSHTPEDAASVFSFSTPTGALSTGYSYQIVSNPSEGTVSHLYDDRYFFSSEINPDGNEAAFDYLGVGESTTVSFQYKVVNDDGLESNVATHTVTVTGRNDQVTDINLSANTVTENDAGAVVGTLTSVDRDVNDTHTYTVSDSRFEVVDDGSGNKQLKLKDGVSLDHETESSVTVSVTANDGNGGTYSENMTINVSDVNEAPTDISIGSTTRSATIVNAGFEDDAFADGGFTRSAPTGWTQNAVQAGAWDVQDSHSFAPAEGENVGYINAGGGTFSQTLSEKLSADTDLNLSVKVATNDAGGTPAGYEVRLYAGNTLLKSVDEGDFALNGENFVDVSINLSAQELQAFSSQYGEDLRIELVSDNTGDNNYFDDVRLDVTDYADSATIDENDAGAIVGNLQTDDPDDGDTHSYTVSDSRFEIVDDGNGTKQLKLKDGVSLDHEAEGGPVTVTVTTSDGNGGTHSENLTVNIADVAEVTVSGSFGTPTHQDREMSQAFSDNFNDGNANGWSVVDVSGENKANNWSVSGGRVVEQSDAGNSFLGRDLSGDVGGNSYEINVNISTDTGNSYNDNVGIVFGYEDSDNYYEVKWLKTSISKDDSDSHRDFVLIKVEDGNPTVLQTVDEVNLGSNFDLQVVVDSSGITVSTDGTERISVSGEQPAIGTFGLSSNDNDSGVSFDNVVINEITEEGHNIPLNISVGLDTPDGAVTISPVVISGIPDGVTLSAGTDNGDGTWTVATSDLAGLSAHVPDGSPQFSVSVTATSTNSADGSTTTATDTVGTIKSGTAGDDILTGTSGDDVFLTQGGADTVTFTGNQGDYTITDEGNGVYTVADNRPGSPDGTDRIVDAKTLQFADGSVEINQAPTDIGLSDRFVFENASNGHVVGTLSATDPDSGESFTYSLTNDAGGKFEIVGDELRVKSGLDYETSTSHSIGVQVTDSAGNTYTENFTIHVDDYAEHNVQVATVRVGSSSDAYYTSANYNGTSQAENISGTSYGETINGNDGNDVIRGYNGNDTLNGGDGKDHIYGGNGNDLVRGGAHDDYLHGGNNDDQLWGGTGYDWLDGGAGNDQAWGETGSDTYTFGLGDGQDYFDGGAGSSWTDTIDIQSNAGEYNTDWTLALTSGSIVGQDGDTLLLSDDADGTITLSDGSQLSFENVEQIEW
ncbi:cadherin domain-containing protein [Coralliovum pocilloporae]|uniref:cadherin domain-containing protein n=1 Tax=Coralliovum pocilloporae TaxID=3066369 RepID=UPI0033077A61